ncbi:MAG: intracellular protease, PfpI family [Phycisphaerales bacterium]|jgi:protease I|nr:intracellular protease, PfpI family [Phycisphaerales bacterium]MDB5356055.1 intracellular protease, PfpI family [Phycisphaerales bacterium]
MADKLSGKKVAILVADGFEEVEMTQPRKALEEAGAGIDLISPNPDRVRSWRFTEWGEYFDVDTALDQANPDDYDALHLPGGVINPDKLRIIPEAVEFVKAFFRAGKPVAAICHGPWTLIDAEVVEGRTVTSWPSLHADLKNAGAKWVDQEVVVDGGLITSRNPDDIPAYNKKMIEEFAEGVHAQQQAAAHA